MPGRVMTPAGQRLLDMLPVAFRRDKQLQAIYNAAGPEVELIDGLLSQLQEDVIPFTAERSLSIYEAWLGISVANPAQTDEERKAVILAFLARVGMDGSGLDWERVAALLIGPGFVYRKHIPGDGGTPPANTLAVYLPFGSPDTISAQLAEALLRAITPANVVINVGYSSLFFLDESLLDIDLL